MKNRLAVVLTITLMFVGSSACPGISPTIVTGETMLSFKESFKSTGLWFWDKCNPEQPGYKLHMVPVNVCQGWADFAKRVQATYGPAQALFDASAALDPASHSAAEAIINSMVADLTSFVSQMAALKAAYVSSHPVLDGGI